MCGRYDNLIACDAYPGLFKANRLPSRIFLRATTSLQRTPMVRNDGKGVLTLSETWNRRQRLEFRPMVAERVGFEPTVRLPVQRFSSSMILVLACIIQWLSVFCCLLFLSR